MSKIEVDQVDPQSGTTLTLGTSGDTVTIPSGVTLANNGTATGFAAIDWQSTVVTGATHTASANQGLWIDTTSNACTLTLPGSPSVGDQLIFSDFKRTWNSNAVTLSLNGSKFQGETSPDPVYDTIGEAVHIVYSGSTQGWIPINDGGPANEVPQAYNIQYLVVAGGGAGGGYYGGGGGAGGLLTSTLSSVAGNVTMTATVGAGGASVSHSGGGVKGNDGVNSSLAGSGFSTVTAIGGGGGGASGTVNGNSGGSGGGGSGDGNGSGGAGTLSQGNNGGTAVSASPDYGAGGGGGAGAVGANGSGSQAGNGGVGVSNSITGSAVFYAGGGGGSSEETASGGAGGNGGGGASGDSSSEAGTAGTDNLGGGGGGANQTQASGKGGSGVVILSVPTANYTGTVTGSPTVTTSGSNTIIKFTGTGTYVT